MSEALVVWLAYAVTYGLIIGYAAWLHRRHRRLLRRG
jgi:heme exporter protein D